MLHRGRTIFDGPVAEAQRYKKEGRKEGSIVKGRKEGRRCSTGRKEGSIVQEGMNEGRK
jgi:hypothetical protein